MQEKLAAPVEEIVLAGIHRSRDLELIHRGNELSVLLLDLAKQIVQLAGIFLLHQGLDKLPGRTGLAAKIVCKRQIITIVIGRWLNALRLLQKRDGGSNFARLDVEL